jgi:cytidylate kinase
MVKLIIINGTMGIGKSSAAKELLKHLNNAVWLDGDWCWMMNPWNFSDENKAMVIDNITHLLNNYLSSKNFNYIIFSWVIHEESIFQTLLSRLINKKYDLLKISLLCSEDKLKERMMKDNRNREDIERSINRLRNYDNLDTLKIDTSNLSLDETVNKILELIK